MTAKDLKNALLQEAVQGKLVPQIASEGNARDLLEEIRKEKLSHGLDLRLEASLAINAKSGKRKSKKETALAGSNPCDITEDEIPFEIPENWCWCRLGDVIDVRDGTHDTPAYIKSGYPLITSKDFRGDHFDFSKTKYISKQDYDLINQRSKVEVGDILFSMIGGNIGNKIIITTENYFEMAIKNVALFKNNNNVYNVYLFYVLEYYTKAFQNYAVGGAQTFVSLNFIRNYPFPLPPFAEQKRIVAAIEKFMPLIEEYGKKETQLKALNEQIGVLTKKAILQEAVQGKLVPQIAAEGNAKDLLEEIKKEKAKLIKEGKIKKEKPLPEISDDEIPFDIPENWCWCRLGEIMYIWSARRVHQSDWKNQGIPFYRAREIGKLADFGYVDNELFISEELYNEYVKTGIPEENDLMITAVGTLGKAYIVKKDDHFYYKDASVISFKNFGRLNSSYLKIIMDSVFMQEQIKNTSPGTTVGTITIQNANHFLIPLPPLAEQKRIVAAIEKMLSLCEKLGV